MDIYCPKCGEPWDLECIHDRIKETGIAPPYGTISYTQEKWTEAYDHVAAEFRRVGCPALGGACSVPNTEVDPSWGLTRAQAASALYEVLGDDMDGAAAMLDDMAF